MRAVPGTTVCRQHGGESPQALARAQVRLTLAELAITDPRPMAEVLRDAVALADVAQRDCWSALRAGELTPAVADRLLETARYSAALVKVAVDSGLPLHDDDDRVPLEGFSDVAADALASIVDQLTGVIEVRSADDVDTAWRSTGLRVRRLWLPAGRYSPEVAYRLGTRTGARCESILGWQTFWQTNATTRQTTARNSGPPRRENPLLQSRILEQDATAGNSRY